MGAAEDFIAASSWGSVIDGTLDDPEFDKATRVHDWRNYVPEEIRAVWGQLSKETRAAVFLMADMQASSEEWD